LHTVVVNLGENMMQVFNFFDHPQIVVCPPQEKNMYFFISTIMPSRPDSEYCFLELRSEIFDSW
jgi:hypothetical protein